MGSAAETSKNAAAVSPAEDVSAAELGDLLGLSARSVTDLAAKGLAIRTGKGRYDLRGTLRAYLAHLRGLAARAGDASLTAERAREVRERADSLALKNAAARRDLVPAAEVEVAWFGILREVRTRMLAVPSRVQQRIVGLTASDVAVIEGEVREALTDAGQAMVK